VSKELIIVQEDGTKVAANLSLDSYKEAAENGLTLRQHLASVHPTNDEKHGSAYAQLLEQLGIFVKTDKEAGIRGSTVGDLLSPAKDAAGVITKDGVPASRLLFPAVILDVIEDKLQVNRTATANALSSMIAVNDDINGDRWERPVLNFNRPEAARSAPVAQLALPNIMMTITASDKAMRIPSWGIGMEISEQALRSTTLDLVGLAVARQAEVEENERAQAHVLSLLQGDPDISMVALSAIAGKVRTAVSFDPAATSGLTQTAWLGWLSRNSTKRTISHIVTDLAGAMAIERRAGKPTVMTDDPNSVRMDTLFNVINPTWPSNVRIFLTEDPTWPANTIMGLDSRYAIHRANSLTAQYSAIENFALKRSTAMRVDKGEMLSRFYDEAFEVLVYA
jgi:hypothetical protein